MIGLGVRRAALTLVSLAACALAFAHKPSDSYLVVIQPDRGASLRVQWDIALRDLEQAIGIDANSDGIITWGELQAGQAEVVSYAASRLVLADARGAVCPLQFEELMFDEHVDGGYAVLRFVARCGERPAVIQVHYTLLFDVDPNHRGLLDVHAGRDTQAFVLTRESPQARAHLGAPARAQELRAFVREGISHIWHGYDHVLFLLTLLLPAVVLYRAGRWEPRASLRDAAIDVLKVVTAFTLAHSLTLSLAVLGVVRLPSRWVESAIAATVLLGALNNLFPVVRERRWLVAFAFGLIHGLGFASVLTDLGLHGLDLAIALFGFNVGVEIGQIAIVLALVPIAFALRDTFFYRRRFMPAGAVAIGGVALYWLAIRALGISMQ